MSDKPKTSRVGKGKAKSTKKAPDKVSFSAGAENSDGAIGNAGDISDQLSHMLQVRNQANDIMAKSVHPVTVRADVKGKYDKTKVVFSTKSYQQGFDGVEVKGYRRLTDQELREIANIDPYISAIISTRCSQGAVVARPSDSKFDKGTRILDLNPISLEDFEDEIDYQKHQDHREKQSRVVLDWVWNCGTRDEDIINEVYVDPRSDQTFKRCSFADFQNAQIRNIMTFGRMATQIIRNEEGLPVMFRPIPVETIFNIRDKSEAFLGNGRDTFDESTEDAEDYNSIPEEYRPYAYVQKVDGRNVNFFTEEDLRIDYFQKQALFDLRGYPLAPIEMALYMVFIHQNTLNYLRNQFVKGLGTKGILTLESTEVAAELSNEDVEQLRREFHNFLNRNDNSATTPVISGPVKVGWIPLTANPRDMEFLQVEEHVIRSLCSSFQTSPQEMGYGNLSMGQGGLNSGNKQEEIVRGEERGLRMLLDVIYDCVNDIFYDNFEEGRDNFRITYTGVGEDTRDAVVSRNNQELQTTATLGSLWADSEKNEPIPAGANVPLAPLFHQNVVRFMKYGYFMEKFMGMEGWAAKSEYDFIVDPMLNQSYQQRLLKDNDMLHAEGQMQLQTEASTLKSLEAQTESMEMQTQVQEAQMQQQAQMPPGMDPNQMPAQGEPAPGEGPPEQGAPPEGEPAEKSLKEEYLSRSGALEKSTANYFSEWIRAHNHIDEDDI